MSTCHEMDSEFSKFLRHFCTRLVQSIVQTRMGQLISHKCAPEPETPDWFNLVVDEIGEVAAYLKSSIKRYPPYCPTVSLDFLLYTADGDSLPLESWIIKVDKNQVDENVNVHTTLYHQMSTLLKSVVMASHFTPAYRYYVRKQSPETFVIFYRVFEGESDLALLGEEMKSRRIGCLPTPFGAINVDLHYRVKMELQPAPFIESAAAAATGVEETFGDISQSMAVTAAEENVLFNQASIPFGSAANAVPIRGSETISLSSPVTEEINMFSTSPLSQDLPFVGEGKSQFKLGRSSSSTEEDTKATQHPSGASSKSESTHSTHASSSYPQRARQIRIRNNSFPFASLLVESQSSFDQTKSQLLPKVPEDAVPSAVAALQASKSEGIFGAKLSTESIYQEGTFEAAPIQDTSQKEEKKKVIFGCSPPENDNEEDYPVNTNKKHIDEDAQSVSSDDSYVKVKAIAFASTEDLGNDLSQFVQEVRLAPDNLHSFMHDGNNSSGLNRELNQFKQRANQFDSFVASLRDISEEPQHH